MPGGQGEQLVGNPLQSLHACCSDSAHVLFLPSTKNYAKSWNQS